MFSALSNMILKLWGWKIEMNFQQAPKKCVYILAPHTSNWDFVMSILVRSAKRIKSNYLAKKELFRFPFGYFFRGLGGYPVDRKSKKKLVQQVIDIFNKEDRFSIGITPEGTRKYNPKWKTGFYYIAKGARVPLILVGFDYKRKKVTFSPPLFTGKEMEEDFQKIRNFYHGIQGKHPKKSYLLDDAQQ